MNRNTSIKNVIFDIGNVLVGYDTDRFLNGLFHGNQEICDRVSEAMWGSALWGELDRGVIPEDEILKGMIARDPEIRDEICLTWEHIGESVYREDHAIPWIEAVKRGGYRVFFLSNYSYLIMHAKPEVLDFLPLMDGGIFSCIVKLVKPDAKIYHRLLDQYRLNPQECLFIDDTGANVSTARTVGMNGMQCRGFRKAQEDLRDLLGLDCPIY